MEGEKKIKVKLTEKEKKSRRNEYMKKYYLKRHHNIVDGEYVKYEPRKPKKDTFSIVHKEVIISFN